MIVRVLQTLMAFSGNAPPQLAVTRKLLEHGHEVRVLAHRAARPRIEATGAEFIPIERAVPNFDISRRETDTLRDWEARSKFTAGIRLRKHALLDFLGPISEECVALLETDPADVILFDWMLSGAAVAAERAGVPSVALVHCPYPLPVAGAPPLFSGVGWMNGPLGTARNRLLNRTFARFSAAGLPRLNRVRTAHGLAPLRAWEEQLLGADAIYVMTAAELDFSSRGELPANVHYVGPAFEPYSNEWHAPWPETNTDPLVVVSFSTSYMNQGQLAQRVLDAVGGLPVRALLTKGPALVSEELALPPNACAVDYVAHRAVLPHAALMVTHAGWQTINAALAEGVPLVCVPDGRDQPDNAARVVAAGAGVRVSKRSSAARLRRAIAAALDDPTLEAGAAAMAVALGRSDGALTIAEGISSIGKARSGENRGLRPG
ncbi:MAG TPA: glycosyltransferase [Solirubrobacterales bacterium]|nr:glycosyltransferase [Solirubrobacterales bacterium]